MNSFLELYSSSDYRLTNRDYYTSTWEYITAASDYLIPFQFETSASDFIVYSINTSGTETDITRYFDVSQLITGWTETGTGSVSNTGATINYWNYTPSSYIQSNNFTLTIDSTAPTVNLFNPITILMTRDKILDGN